MRYWRECLFPDFWAAPQPGETWILLVGVAAYLDPMGPTALKLFSCLLLSSFMPRSAFMPQLDLEGPQPRDVQAYVSLSRHVWLAVAVAKLDSSVDGGWVTQTAKLKCR